MARNQEKAQSMLNRWLVYKRTEAATEFGAKERNFKRPTNPFTVESVAECDRWRMQIIRDIGRRIMDIQNGGT